MNLHEHIERSDKIFASLIARPATPPSNFEDLAWAIRHELKACSTSLDQMHQLSQKLADSHDIRQKTIEYANQLRRMALASALLLDLAPYEAEFKTWFSTLKKQDVGL
jgi:hypothetical protein